MVTIKIKQYGATFSKNNIDVEEEVIRKLKIFDWYFKYNNSVACDRYILLTKVKKQISEQFDCNERLLTFKIEV